MAEPRSMLPQIIARHEGELLAQWLQEQKANSIHQDSGQEAEARQISSEFLRNLKNSLSSSSDVQGAEFALVRELLADLSRSRGVQGYSPAQTATYIFSFKKPLFAAIKKELGNNAEGLASETWNASELIDKLGLFTMEVHQKTREEVISRQQQEMMELSTPVVKLWSGILALPLIGTLDSERTQVVMESLLQKIVQTGSDIAIIDITGVPTVDTLVAQHLLKTITAARLMGAECIISGIRPQIAQTIVHLGVDLGGVTTKASLADAFAMAIQKRGFTVSKIKSAGLPVAM
ncbi:MAG: STAS domain-containing protein [Verrucomicrobiota bacterium]|nr:STAS domain-containing protein [Verrucomicrobiota bacterium]